RVRTTRNPSGGGMVRSLYHVAPMRSWRSVRPCRTVRAEGAGATVDMGRWLLTWVPIQAAREVTTPARPSHFEGSQRPPKGTPVYHEPGKQRKPKIPENRENPEKTAYVLC